VVPEKGIELVLNSMSLLKAMHNKNVSLTVCGDGSSRYFKHLKKLASKLEVELILLGHRESPFDTLLGEIDAVVVPSIWQEPLGRIPMESLSRGIPCFVSGIGGLLESKFFLDGPLVYFEPENEIDLVETILNALESGIQIFKATEDDKNINIIVEKALRSLEISKG
jgi:glycosyltransferase involved in cell wall biosynthesis